MLLVASSFCYSTLAYLVACLAALLPALLVLAAVPGMAQSPGSPSQLRCPAKIVRMCRHSQKKTEVCCRAIWSSCTAPGFLIAVLPGLSTVCRTAATAAKSEIAYSKD
jgi:hypothetical protein